MRAAWEDVNARARGLARHLIGPAALEQLAEAPDLAALVRAARATGALLGDVAEHSPSGLELAFRRDAGRRFALLLRWIADRAALLRVVVDDEDRRSVRAIVRGAVAGAPAEDRLAGLIPTPLLGERLLEELARQPRPREVAGLLASWGHPFGPPALAAAAAEHPNLARFELSVDQEFARRAIEGARQGDDVLREFVAETIDYANLSAALVLAGAEMEQPPETAFLAGGRRLTREGFRAAVAARAGAAKRLAEALQPDEAADLVETHAAEPAALSRALLALRIRRLRTFALHDPLGSATVLGYFLRLRAQQENLRLLVWAAALRAPSDLRRTRLVRSA